MRNPKDNSHAGITGSPILDAYELNGTLKWRIDLGKNIRDGEHYTQFMVYDLDGDGKAEIACKTADGTVDGRGTVIGDATKDYRIHNERSRSFGRIVEGPEFFTIFDGETGAALKTVDYVPGRDPIDGWGGIGGNGGNDSYGNRCDRFLACVAYLDGERPSVVMCRGVYGRIVMAAWDWRGSNLTQRWVFDSGIRYPPFDDASKFSGMGGHSLSVADIDPRHPGFEAWGGPGGLWNATGESIGRAPRNTAYAIWWDGDLLRELIGRRGRITKWDWESEQETPILTAEGRGAPRGPNLIGDIIGDWREEVVLASRDGQSLRIYTTTIPTEHRIYTLMQDPQYRLSITWQNVVYNKPPHTSFFLGHEMATPPVPAIKVFGN